MRYSFQDRPVSKFGPPIWNCDKSLVARRARSAISDCLVNTMQYAVVILVGCPLTTKRFICQGVHVQTNTKLCKTRPFILPFTKEQWYWFFLNVWCNWDMVTPFLDKNTVDINLKIYWDSQKIFCCVCQEFYIIMIFDTLYMHFLILLYLNV